MKKCKACKGLGLINIQKMDARGGTICPICKGFGVPYFDEDFDNAKTFMNRGDEDDEGNLYLDDEE